MDPPVYLLLVLAHTLSTVSSRRYILRTMCTSSVGLGQAEFTAVILMNELQVAHYDEHLKELVTTQDWVKKAAKKQPRQWDRQKSVVTISRDLMKNIMEDQKNISTEGVVVLQASVGCEWDSDTDQTSGFLHFGLNAQDFLRFTPETQSWTTEAPEAQWNRDMFERQTGYWNHYLTKKCPQWMKTLQKHGGRIEFPDIYFTHRPGTYVSCQARRFYPEEALMFWTKDGEVLHEDVEYGDIRPNGDGTFQTRADLNLSQVRREDWERYKCVFELSGVRDIITIPEIEACEKGEQPEQPEQPEDKSLLALFIFNLLLFLGGPAAVFFIDRRRRCLRNTEEPEPPEVEMQLSIHQSREELVLFKQA